MRIDPSIPPDLTPAITYLRGTYALWQYQIPYYTAVVPLAFVAEKLSLIEEIPAEPDFEWSIEELFQREISWDRIERELLKYLRNENRPQFFNALTVALLPKTASGFGSGFKEVDGSLPRIEDPELDDPIQVGGVQLQAYRGSGGLAGKLRWDINRVIAVAVDGQHRLAAIKELKKHVRPDKLAKSHQALIVLIPDRRAGFVEPPLPPETSATVATLRRIFVDLNKNARDVSPARTILLNDLDPLDVCTRSLIAERLTDAEEKDRIPLGLVDWVSDRNKIEEGPFLTTVLMLQWITRTALSPPPFQDFKVRDITRWLSDCFRPDPRDLAQLVDQAERCFSREVPLTFSPVDIDTLRKCFETRWRPLLYRFFRELKPYADLWEYGAAENLHKPVFVNLYIASALSEGSRAKQREEAIVAAIQQQDENWTREKRYSAPLQHIEEEIKHNAWAFKVVFQKGLAKSFLGLMTQAELFVEAKASDEVEQDYVTRWIAAINALLDSRLATTDARFLSGKEEFWAGICRHADKTIDYRASSVERIASWLNAWVSLYWLEGDIPTFAKLRADERPLAQVAANSLRLEKESGRVWQGLTRVVEARAEETLSAEDAKDAARTMLKARYDYLRGLARRVRPQHSDAAKQGDR